MQGADMAIPTHTLFHRYLATSFLVLSMAFPALLSAQTLGDTPWTEYFGSSTGPHEGWGRTSRVGSDRTRQIKAALKDGDNIFVGDSIGLSSARKEAEVAIFMDSVEADDGTAFRQKVLNRALKLHQLQLKLGSPMQEIYWQFGNEITSLKYVLNLRAWAKQPVEPARTSDPWIIPYYVEYYLAPAIQSIIQAEVLTGTEIPVLLGSIGNANNPARREFLYELLDYEVVGSYASDLAGLRVAEIVDFIDIHYLIAKSVHLKNEKGKYIKRLKGSYEIALDEIYDPWIAAGPVKGIWTSEEVGRSASDMGHGAAKAMLVTARYLHWWSKHDISSENARALYFGTSLGPVDVSADLAMQTLFSFLGHSPLVEIIDAALPPAGDWETYVFESVDNNNKRVAFILPSWSDIESNSFTEFQIDATLWPGDVTADVIVYGLGATTATSAEVIREGELLTVVLPDAISPDTSKPPSIVVLLERSE